MKSRFFSLNSTARKTVAMVVAMLVLLGAMGLALAVGPTEGATANKTGGTIEFTFVNTFEDPQADLTVIKEWYVPDSGESSGFRKLTDEEAVDLGLSATFTITSTSGDPLGITLPDDSEDRKSYSYTTAVPIYTTEGAPITYSAEETGCTNGYVLTDSRITGETYTPSTPPVTPP